VAKEEDKGCSPVKCDTCAEGVGGIKCCFCVHGIGYGVGDMYSPKPTKEDSLRKCQSCGGMYFNITESGTVVCVSMINGKAGCGWKWKGSGVKRPKAHKEQTIWIKPNKNGVIDHKSSIAKKQPKEPHLWVKYTQG
jgi:hypothetical protein